MTDHGAFKDPQTKTTDPWVDLRVTAHEKENFLAAVAKAHIDPPATLSKPKKKRRTFFSLALFLLGIVVGFLIIGLCITLGYAAVVGLFPISR